MDPEPDMLALARRAAAEAGIANANAYAACQGKRELPGAAA